MKKNISILVLLGLLLAFGMLAASCDNGVLPNYTPDPNHTEEELAGRQPAPTTPPAATVKIDFFTTTGGVTTLGGDDKADGPTMSAADAALLAGIASGLYMEDPSIKYGPNVFNVTFAAGTIAGTTDVSIKATKGSAAAAGVTANVDANGNPI